jgi:hypothetical protein
MKNLIQPIEITDKEYVDTDEIYAPFYKCKVCEETSLREGFNFCSNCGIKLTWKLTDKHNPYASMGYHRK